MKKKVLKSPGYNYIFDPANGDFIRWGETVDDDPDYSPFGPEIADIEITTSCSGPAGKVCTFCYKANTPQGKNMSLDTFKQVFEKLPKTLTQIAFGADATLAANPDIWDIMQHCRDNEVVPNITVANIDYHDAGRLAHYCGAVAVSRYHNKNWCYDSVARLASHGLQQVNIHQLIAEETFDAAMETLRDYSLDTRLMGLNAIVFLSLKQKGRGEGYNRLSDDKFTELVHTALELQVPFGFDSCTANKFLAVINQHYPDKFKSFYQFVEPCESTCFSVYINVDGDFFPCSFSEHKDFKVGNWTEGIHIPAVDSFETVWYDKKTTQFRDGLLSNLDNLGIRSCPLYNI